MLGARWEGSGLPAQLSTHREPSHYLALFLNLLACLKLAPNQGVIRWPKDKRCDSSCRPQTRLQ